MITHHPAAADNRRGPVQLRVPVLLAAAAASLALSACSGSSTGDAASSAPASTAASPTAGTSTAAATTAAPAASTSSGSAAGGSGAGGANSDGTVVCTPTVMTFTAQHVDQIQGREIDKVIATNASGQPCITTGYPGVDVIGQDGSTLASASRNTQVTARTITVQPGQTVSSVITADATKPFAQCPRSAAILFTMPDNTDSTRLTLDFGSCDVIVSPLETAG